MHSLTTVEYQHYPKRPLSDFIDELEFEFQGSITVEYGVLEHTVRRAARYIARHGNILQRKAVIHTQQCVDNYRLEPPDCVDVLAVTQVCNIKGGICGCVQRVNVQPCNMPCGTIFWYDAPDVVHIHPGRDCAAYEITMVVMPTQDACEIDEIYYTKFYELLLDTTRMFLFDMDGKPWSNFSRAERIRPRVQSGIAAAGIDVITGWQRGIYKTKRKRIL